MNGQNSIKLYKAFFTGIFLTSLILVICNFALAEPEDNIYNDGLSVTATNAENSNPIQPADVDEPSVMAEEADESDTKSPNSSFIYLLILQIFLLVLITAGFFILFSRLRKVEGDISYTQKVLLRDTDRKLDNVINRVNQQQRELQERAKNSENDQEKNRNENGEDNRKDHRKKKENRENIPPAIPEPKTNSNEIIMQLFIKDYNDAVRNKINGRTLDTFYEKYMVSNLNLEDHDPGINDSSLGMVFKLSEEGLYLAIDNEMKPDLSWVVPKFGIRFGSDHYGRGGMSEVFSIQNYESPGTYDRIELIKPAVFKKSDWKMMEKGEIHLHET